MGGITIYLDYLEKIDKDIAAAKSIEVEQKRVVSSLNRGSEFISETKIQGEMGLEFTQDDGFVAKTTVIPVDVRTVMKNPLVNATIRKIEKFIFEGVELFVVPPDDIADDVKKEETQNTQNMVETIDRYAFRTALRLRQAWRDKRGYGSALFERINGDIPGPKGKTLKGPVVFKRLPAFSFDTAPTTMLDTMRYVSGELLKGIVFDMVSGETSYFQRQALIGEPYEFDPATIIQVKDDTSDMPDGESVMVTLIPLVNELNYADRCMMRYLMRIGSPNLDVVIKEYRDSIAVNVDAWDTAKAFKEAKKIGQNWSNATVLTHPDCIELKPMDWSKSADPAKIVSFISDRILNVLIPRDFVETKGTLPQSGGSSIDILNLWARGEQHDLEEWVLEEWRAILQANGKEGWRVEIVWREMTPDSSSELWNRTRIARDVGVFTPDEIREIVEYPGLSDAQRDEIAAIPAKGNNPGDKINFNGDPSGSPPNAKPGAFNGPPQKANGVPTGTPPGNNQVKKKMGSKGKR